MATVKTTTVSPPAAMSFLSKEYGVGPLKSTVSIWISLAILLLTVILHIVVIAIPDWARFPAFLAYPASKVGLWKLCNYVCSDLGADDTLRAVRAFAILALLLMFVALAISFLIISPVETRKLFCIILIGCHAVITLFLMIAFAVYTNRKLGLKIGTYVYKGSYGPAFGLEVFCFLLELVATVILLVDFFVNRK